MRNVDCSKEKSEDYGMCLMDQAMAADATETSDPSPRGPDCQPFYEAAARISDTHYCNTAGAQATLQELDETTSGLLYCGDADMGNSSVGPTPEALSYLRPKEWQLKGRTSSHGDAGAFSEQGYNFDPCAGK